VILGWESWTESSSEAKAMDVSGVIPGIVKRRQKKEWVKYDKIAEERKD
jgi:hypothetical protein